MISLLIFAAVLLAIATHSQARAWAPTPARAVGVSAVAAIAYSLLFLGVFAIAAGLIR